MRALAAALLTTCVFACSGSEPEPTYSAMQGTPADGGSAGSAAQATDDVSVPEVDSSSNDAPGAALDALDPGQPPAECTPPCLWNIFKTCRIIPPCWDEAVDGGVMSCRPATGVTWFVSSTKRTVYNADGSVCYTADLGASTVYHDAAGTISIPVTSLGQQMLQATCDGVSYPFHPNTPECMASLGSTGACAKGPCPDR